jgi:hypothetical protein
MSTPLGLDIIDTRVAKAPKEYDGSAQKWKHFKVQLLGHLGGLSQELREMCRICEDLNFVIKPNEMLSARQVELSGKLYVILSGCCNGDALDTVCNTDEGNGIEVYRKLARRWIPR